ncbi:hypothetical protein ACFP1Z_29840 [Streptomyces gamaensis]|uniref:DUF416 family protein n=1 Tax=Streptomyces gamaensis TaxID=1763542 RepID=A0ABW0Z8U2_9ACTN
MNMEIPPELRAISTASPQGLTLICAAAAERGAAFCRTLGAQEDLAWVERSLELAWAVAAGEPVQDECAEALDELDLESGCDEDDPSSPDFYVAQSVALVGNALAVSLHPSAAKAEMSVNTLKTLFSMLDFKLGGERTVIIRFGEATPPPGVLTRREIDAEWENIWQLTQRDEATVPHEAVVQARESARAFSGRAAEAITEVAELSNWDVPVTR